MTFSHMPYTAKTVKLRKCCSGQLLGYAYAAYMVMNSQTPNTTELTVDTYSRIHKIKQHFKIAQRIYIVPILNVRQSSVW